MRSLLDEYGYFIITLIVSGTLLVGAIFGTVIPQMKGYVKDVVPENDGEITLDYTAIRGNIERPTPTITVPELQTDQYELVVFNNYISDGVITAQNADGVDLSHKIEIEPADEETAMFYDKKTRTFGGSGLYGGEYKFVLSVVDATDDEYYGKKASVMMTIKVEETE